MSLNKQRFIVVAAMFGWCFLLVILRPAYSYLIWNLELAAIPLLASTLVRLGHKWGRLWLACLGFVAWLAFLPNSPYILTDFAHLAELHTKQAVPAPWFNVAMLASCAGAGLFFGYLSLLEVQAVVEARWNKAAGWLVAIGSLSVCGFGIYVGRFLRWNSWQVVTNPLFLWAQFRDLFVHPGDLPNPLYVSFVYGFSLILGYMGLHVIARSAGTSTSE